VFDFVVGQNMPPMEQESVEGIIPSRRKRRNALPSEREPEWNATDFSPEPLVPKELHIFQKRENKPFPKIVAANLLTQEDASEHLKAISDKVNSGWPTDRFYLHEASDGAGVTIYVMDTGFGEAGNTGPGASLPSVSSSLPR
jgi:hypothetical protein